MFERMPREILEKAAQLPDPLKQVYIALYSLGEPSTASKVAEAAGKARAYVSMRLNQLETMGLVKSSKKGRRKLFMLMVYEGKEVGKNQP